jgi:hypothetical protein
MYKFVTTNAFLEGLQASIPALHGKLFRQIEIRFPRPFGATPVELHCVEILDERAGTRQDVVYCLTTDEKLVGANQLMWMIQRNFPWLDETHAIDLRIHIHGGEYPTIELTIVPQAEDGKFVLSGLYMLEEKERGSEYRE